MTPRFDLIRKNILAMVALGALVLGAAFLVWSPAGAQTSGSSSPLGKAQLEQLVAPIALYPDDLMSQVLMASTYPLEVVAAARWSRDNKSVNGKALEDAMTKQSWDPSVKALAAVPQTLEMMNDKLTWTQQLGDAFLAQQQDVLDAVQRLRQRAEEAGNLKTTPQQFVRRTSASTTTGSASSEPAVIAIAPTDPEMLYVPIYDPGVVYGDWPYADYQPFYWYPSGFVASNVLSFATGVAVGAAIWGNVDWRRRNVNINVDRYNQFNRTRIVSNDWNHNPAHRGAVPYRDRNVSDKFGGAQKAAAREGFRDQADAGRRELSKQSGGKECRQECNQERNAESEPENGGASPRRSGAAARELCTTRQAGWAETTQQADRAKANRYRQSRGRATGKPQPAERRRGRERETCPEFPCGRWRAPRQRRSTRGRRTGGTRRRAQALSAENAGRSSDEEAMSTTIDKPTTTDPADGVKESGLSRRNMLLDGKTLAAAAALTSSPASNGSPAAAMFRRRWSELRAAIMPIGRQTFCFTRRILFGITLLASWGADASAQAVDPLPSWNDAGPKQAIVEFVSRVTQEVVRISFRRPSASRLSTMTARSGANSRFTSNSPSRSTA